VNSASSGERGEIGERGQIGSAMVVVGVPKPAD